MTKRYVAYRQSPYPWEVQFAAIEPRSLIAPFYASNDQNAAIFALALWADWFGEAAFLWDNTEGKWIASKTTTSPGAEKAVSPMREA